MDDPLQISKKVLMLFATVAVAAGFYWYIVEKVLEQWPREDQLQQLQWLKVVMVVIY